MGYVDLNTIHNPATGTAAPATWGDQIRENLHFLASQRPGFTASDDLATTQNVNTGGSATVLTVAASEMANSDPDGMHSGTTNTGRGTAITAGIYGFSGCVLVDNANTGGTSGRRELYLQHRDSANNILGTYRVSCLPAVQGLIHTFYRELRLAAGDYVQMAAFQNSGSTLIYKILSWNARYIMV